VSALDWILYFQRRMYVETRKKKRNERKRKFKKFARLRWFLTSNVESKHKYNFLGQTYKYKRTYTYSNFNYYPEQLLYLK
jgi:uncharacterized membrane protein